MKHTTVITALMMSMGLVSTASAQSAFSGSITASSMSSSVYSSDDSAVWKTFGGYTYEGFVQGELAGFDVMADFSGLQRNIGGTNNWFREAPEKSSVLGLHIGRNFGSTYVGGFAAVGQQQRTRPFSEFGNMIPGTVFGLEAAFNAGPATLFGQIGNMDWSEDPTDPTPDNSFIGQIYRAGASMDINDRLNVMFDIESGLSPNGFEDFGDWGQYVVAGVEVSYAFTDSASVVVGYESGTFTANTEDYGREQNLTLGLRMSFGGAGTNVLKTPGQGFAAAGWAATTD